MSQPASQNPAPGAEINEEMAKKIQYIQRSFPQQQYSDKFLAACLAHYNGNRTTVINRLILKNMPPELMALDDSPEVVPEGAGEFDAQGRPKPSSKTAWLWVGTGEQAAREQAEAEARLAKEQAAAEETKPTAEDHISKSA